MSSSTDLTTAEWNALNALECTPFFAATATNDVFTTDELAMFWQGRKAKLDAERLQPYSDILYEDIRAELMGMKSVLSLALKQTIADAKHPRDIKVEFKSFFSTYEPSWPRKVYEGSDTWNAMVEFGREEYVRAQTILDNELDCRIGVMRNEDIWDDGDCGCAARHFGYNTDDESDATPEPTRKSWMLPPERTYNIVKKTDLLERLGALFGPNFFVSLKSEPEERIIGGRVYLIYRNTFVLNYLTQQLPGQRKVVGATLVKYATHENYQLTSRDTVVGLLGEKVVNSLSPK
jgi:hypothetical protein